MEEQDAKPEAEVSDADRAEFEKVVAKRDRCSYSNCTCSEWRGTSGNCASCGHSWRYHS